MDRFLSAHGEKVTGTISVFDRLIIKGHLPLGYPGGMEKLLSREHRLLKHLKPFVLSQSERIREHARRLAQESGRPYEYCNSKVQKDQCEFRKLRLPDSGKSGFLTQARSRQGRQARAVPHGLGRGRLCMPFEDV